MDMRHAVIAAALTLAAAAPVSAEGLKPVQAQGIELGTLSGVAYYTVERDGFRVVATLAQGEDAAPVRVEAMLTPGQRMVLSVPHGVGIPSETVEISRQADAVVVRQTGAAVTN